MQLSENFFLSEFLVSQTAARHGIDMTPPDDIIENVSCLVETCLQPLRSNLGQPITITSGYRPRILNALIGGSKTSAHPDGRAADFRVLGIPPLVVCRTVRALELPFDQVINEFGSWTHLGIARAGEDPRRELLTAYHDRGRTRYQVGLVDVGGLKA